jgi:hypothetical protein
MVTPTPGAGPAPAWVGLLDRATRRGENRLVRGDRCSILPWGDRAPPTLSASPAPPVPGTCFSSVFGNRWVREGEGRVMALLGTRHRTMWLDPSDTSTMPPEPGRRASPRGARMRADVATPSRYRTSWGRRRGAVAGLLVPEGRRFKGALLPKGPSPHSSAPSSSPPPPPAIAPTSLAAVGCTGQGGPGGPATVPTTLYRRWASTMSEGEGYRPRVVYRGRSGMAKPEAPLTDLPPTLLPPPPPPPPPDCTIGGTRRLCKRREGGWVVG